MLTDIDEEPSSPCDEHHWSDRGDQPATAAASVVGACCASGSTAVNQVLLEVVRSNRERVKRRRKALMKEMLALDGEEAMLDAQERTLLSLLANSPATTLNPTKLLRGDIDDVLIIKAMNSGMATLFGDGSHTLVDGHTVWKDYHVAACLLFFLIINGYACDSLEYGMRSQFYRHCVSGGKCKTMMSCKQFSNTVSILTSNDMKKKVKMDYDDVEGETSSRTSMRQWYSLYWRLSDVFEKILNPTNIGR